jgi:hypothetical protein
MEMEQIVMYAGLGIVWASATYWAYKRYKKIMADGKITLDEVVDAVNDSISVITDAIGDTKELSAMKKVDLVKLCKEHNIPVSGTKAELIERLQKL